MLVSYTDFALDANECGVFALRALPIKTISLSAPERKNINVRININKNGRKNSKQKVKKSQSVSFICCFIVRVTQKLNASEFARTTHWIQPLSHQSTPSMFEWFGFELGSMCVHSVFKNASISLSCHGIMVDACCHITVYSKQAYRSWAIERLCAITIYHRARFVEISCKIFYWTSFKQFKECGPHRYQQKNWKVEWKNTVINIVYFSNMVQWLSVFPRYRSFKVKMSC